MMTLKTHIALLLAGGCPRCAALIAGEPLVPCACSSSFAHSGCSPDLPGGT
jgi:hypothetical protein